MSFLTRLLGRGNNEQRGIPLNSIGGWNYLRGGRHDSVAGEIVDNRSALADAAVFTVVRIISESMASLPLRLLKVSDTGRTLAKNHDVYGLLACRPNPEMSPFNFIASAVLSLALSGNSYVQIVIGQDGRPKELWPLVPTHVEPMRQDGELVYRVNVAKDGEIARWVVLPKEQMLHTRLFATFTGLKSASPIELQRNLIGLSIAQVKNAARLFANASIPAMVLTNKSAIPMAPESKTQVREDFQELMGNANTHRIAVLDSDFSLEKMGYSNEESQWLESQQLSIERIASLWRVPPYLVGSTAKVTNSNMQEQNAVFFSECLKSYAVNICQEFAAKLLTPAERMLYELEFDYSDMLLTTYESKAAYYTAAINGGWLAPNECRAALQLPHAGPALDQYRCAINIGNANMLLAKPHTEDENDSEDGEPAVPENNMKTALRNYGAVYLPLFSAGVRSIVDGANVTVLGPALESMAGSTGAEIEAIVPVLSKLEKRSKTWSADNIDAHAIDAMKTAVKALLFASHESQAKKELETITI